MTNVSTLSLATAAGLFFFGTDEIVRLEASSNYTRIFFTNNTKLTSAKVLKEFDRLLVPAGFLRTHRKHLVNPRYISFVSHDGSIVMKDASRAEVSRRMKSGVMKILRNAS
jgi:two-component system LytT family response regulator